MQFLDEKAIRRRRLELKVKPDFLFPSYLAQPYQRAKAGPSCNFVPRATVDIEVAGTVRVGQLVGFPQLIGTSLPPRTASLLARSSALGKSPNRSDLSATVTTRDQMKVFPAGLSSPVIDRALRYCVQ
jgi:hypothetical protein